MKLRDFAPTLLVCSALTPITLHAADEFPSRTVYLVVPYAAGGGTDALTRIMSRKLSEKWRQPVVVENKPGSGGVIGSDLVAHALPDGYTLGWIASSMTTTPSLVPKLSYNPVSDFSPITEVAYVPDVLVVAPSLPVHTVRELIDLAKAQPGKLNFSSAGIGSPSHLQMTLLMQQTSIDMVHVPYTGGPAAVMGVAGNETQLRFATMPSVIGPIKAGTLRAVAVSSHVRSPLIPEIPTVAEALGLKDFPGSDSDWTGVLAPKGTPREIVDKINHDIAEVARLPDVQQNLTAIGYVAVVDSPENFGMTIRNDIARWAPFLKGTAK